MKKLVVILALVAGIFATDKATASNGLVIVDITTPTNLRVMPVGDLKMRVAFQHAEATTLVTLKAKNGEVLFSEYAPKGDAYVKLFDVSNLADGTYTFVIGTGKNAIEKSFEIATKVSRTAVL